MTAELAARAGGPAECAGVEVEYLDPDPGRERRPLAACWSARFKRVSPVRGFASFRGQRNWPGWSDKRRADAAARRPGRAGGRAPAPGISPCPALSAPAPPGQTTASPLLRSRYTPTSSG